MPSKPKAVLTATVSKKLRRALTAEITNVTRHLDDLAAQISALVDDGGSRDTEFGEEGGGGGTVLFDLDRLRSDHRSETERLAVLNDTIEALDQGSYGKCEKCDQPIPVERLEAVLGTTICVSCKVSY